MHRLIWQVGEGQRVFQMYSHLRDIAGNRLASPTYSPIFGIAQASLGCAAQPKRIDRRLLQNLEVQ